MSDDIEKSWGDVLVAASVHHKSLIDGKVINEARMKLSVSARREESKRLILPVAEGGDGLSKRQAARVLGVHHSTVQADLAENPPTSGGISATRELLSQSDQNDWRTPRKFLDAARAVMGAIDLDPATSVEANETVDASEFYTEARA